NNIYAPSVIPYNNRHAKLKEITKEDIKNFKRAFRVSIKRALKAGFNAIKIYNAYSYLFYKFISLALNKRINKYSSSFQNRIRLILKLINLMCKTIPTEIPLFLRISAID
ncbi:FMN-linked oxidoreductase, partial [Cenococcum geophilum 1.58]|uniref:FMN-linked oxidoreductase n=1 Tax=Cenococcum geophilum 1.58 TaxID=794803 RepID=UPI00358DDBB7